MRLSAALLPPEPVLDDLAAVMRSVPGSTRELELVPAHLLHLPLGHFGNVSMADRTELREVLGRELAGWPRLELRVRGGAALLHDGDDSVWAKLDGDLDELVALGALVPRVVQRLGFLIDRRTFRPLIRVARVTETTSLSLLERVLHRLDGYVGPAWTTHDVALMRHRVGDGDDETLELLHLVSFDQVVEHDS